MFKQSSSDSNKSLVKNLCDNKSITHPLIKSAFFKVDRSQYAPRDPYKDSPQDISYQATISAPSMHAKAVNSLLPFLLPKFESEQMVEGMDYICGVRDDHEESWTLETLVGEQGLVVGIHQAKELRNLGEVNIRKSEEGVRLLDSGRVRFHAGDGRKGWSEKNLTDANEGGWDAIHVGAGSIRLHDELVRQLRSPGRLFVPIAEEESWFSEQHIWTVDKDEKSNVTKTKHCGVRNVWLKDAPEEAMD